VQNFCLNLLNKAKSNQSGCCQYVKDSYYKFPRECFPDAFRIDSNTIENNQQILICMVIHKSDCNHGDDQCIIYIQRIVNSPEWDRCCELCIALGSWLGGVDPPNQMVLVCHLPMSEEECKRVYLPYSFAGVMFALGKHVNQYQAFRNYINYSGTHHLNLLQSCWNV